MMYVPSTKRAGIAALAAGIFMLVSPAYAQDEAGVSIEAAFADDLALSEKLGQSLYERDTAAFLAATALQQEFDADELSWVKGWMTLKEGDQYKVQFVGESQDGPRSYFTAMIQDNEVIDTFPPPGGNALTDSEMAIWRARQDALTQEFTRCAENYNPVVIPYGVEGEGSGGLFVYLMPASHDRMVFKAGGYQLFDYSADGKSVKGSMEFSRNCLDIEKKEEQEGDLILSHTLTEYPQEHHVFMSLLHDTDVVVVTQANSYAWRIEDGNITFWRKQGE